MWSVANAQDEKDKLVEYKAEVESKRTENLEKVIERLKKGGENE